MAAPRIHTNELLAEYQRIIETNFKDSLNLKGIYRGSLVFFAGQRITEMVNGVRIDIDPDIKIEVATIASTRFGMLCTYNFRFVLVRRIQPNEIVLERKISDTNQIVEKLIDEFKLSNLSLTNGQVLWSLPTGIELNNGEDSFLEDIAADLVASAFTVQCQVRTNR